MGDLLVIGCELADESLQSLLKRMHANGGAEISREDTVRYLLDAAEALDYLGRPIHQFNNQTVGIQHRDIKPANLLVQGGAIKVGDFGLAKALQGLAESGSLSMTIAYAPPEAFSGQVTPYSDQYLHPIQTDSGSEPGFRVDGCTRNPHQTDEVASRSR